MASWVIRELIQADFGDMRLSDRLIDLVELLAEHPEAALPQACGRAGAKAAYRFFDNPSVSPEAILAPHAARTVQRAKEHAVVLAPQDTTTFSFNHHPATKGLGYVGSDRDSWGLLMHSLMLLGEEGTPLGILHQEMWSRDGSQYGKSEHARQRPIEEKESRCWLKGLEAVEGAGLQNQQVVVIGDQGADIFELFAQPRPAHVHLLVRVSRRMRRVDHPEKYLEIALKNTPARGQVTIAIPRADDREARTASLTLRWCSLIVQPPRNHPQRSRLSPLVLQFLLAEEEHPPTGAEPVSWLLGTTLPLENWDDALRLVRWYTYRWRIERLHFVLKSGCRIEQLQLETAERLQRAIACYLVVAWRLLWLTYEARQHPERTCDGILEAHEWRALVAKLRPRQPLPNHPPTLRDAVRMIAQLGGFLARKRDGEPGVKTLWRGLRRLEDLSAGWKLAQSQLPRGQPLASYG